MLDAGPAPLKKSTAGTATSKTTARRDDAPVAETGSKRPPWITPKRPRPETIELTDAAIGARGVQAYAYSDRSWRKTTLSANQRGLATTAPVNGTPSNAIDGYKWIYAKEQGSALPGWFAVRPSALEHVAKPETWVQVVDESRATTGIYNAKTFERREG